MIETVKLGPTGRQTTRIGFGCAHLAGAIGRRESMEMLECAYKAGIRHFDVARMYGSGDAEKCLGEFARRHRDQITITTKFGISPGRKRSRFANHACNALRRVILPFKHLQHAVERLSPAPEGVQTSFRVEDAIVSLDSSITALRTEHIDLLLLHEATVADLKDDRLLQFLENAVASGRIGAFGVGSDRSSIDDLIDLRPLYCRVLQYQWSVLDELPRREGSFRLHHGAFGPFLRLYYAKLANDSERCRRWSEAVGFDLSKQQNFDMLAFKGSLVANPSSIIIFASRRPKHITQNCATADNAELVRPAWRLYELIQEHANGGRIQEQGPGPCRSEP